MEADSSTDCDTIMMTVFHQERPRDYYIPVSELGRLITRDWEFGLEEFAPLSPVRLLRIVYGDEILDFKDICIYNTDHLAVFTEKMLFFHLMQNGEMIPQFSHLSHPKIFNNSLRKALQYFRSIMDFY